MDKTKAFLEFLVKGFVVDTEAVGVNATADERGMLLTLHVAKEDMGRVVGKDGQTARAIRQIIRLVASHENIKVNLRIAEPLGDVVGTFYAEI